MPTSPFRIELAAATRLAAPVVASQIGIMLMGVVDTMMLGHLSADALAAGGLGHIITTTFMLLGYGLLSALDPLIAQAHGAEATAALAGGRHTLSQYWPGWRTFAAEVRALRKYLLMLRIGLPIAVHNTLELGIFALAALLIGRIGVDDLGGHQIAINLASLSFMVPLGISGAASTRVGNAIGRGDLPAARRAAAACLLLGGGAMLGFAILFAAFP